MFVGIGVSVTAKVGTSVFDGVGNGVLDGDGVIVTVGKLVGVGVSISGIASILNSPLNTIFGALALTK